ncbi:ADP-ribose pyrophosphatase YjhB (NUDIX family) [Larkinella arboricola]|uniref:ADP-ribose pyrophosphatase YjhB (NUDIX family) n=1 Tax=Larkinella arboricola TaxID=643671 RepID=A0A327WQJ5_LARAB|nr:NUDIX hydrolase [Larkinella arboricola]RAJ94484.1 ADP-ribose pyrophosphatase YjhB (NUDIX family) [Larkinella arboricola]
MHRKPLLNLLMNYQPVDEDERRMLEQTIQFVHTHADCFERHLSVGHVTGSAWIVSPDRRQVVLLHHAKLDRWFQPGGHADGDPDVLAVALREAEEETGLLELKVVSSAIFDVDVHTIPARATEPEHLHYDIRFMLEAATDSPFIKTRETKDVRWVNCSEIENLTSEKSILRMKSKINADN